MESSSQFQQLSEQRKRIDNLLTELNVDFINKIKGRLINEKEPYTLAKISFMFRMRALGFHLRTMEDYLQSIPQRLVDLDYDSRKAGSSPLGLYIGSELSINVLHLFESVLFNMVSLLDYTGSLVCCCLEKPNTKKWEGLKKACYSKENLFNQLKLADSVKIFEHKFVDRLYKLRSEIIHDRNIGINVKTTWDLMNVKYEVTILAPQVEVKKFSELRNLENQSLMDFAFWLLRQTFDGVEKILNDLQSDIELNRKIPAGKEVIIVR